MHSSVIKLKFKVPSLVPVNPIIKWIQIDQLLYICHCQPVLPTFSFIHPLHLLSINTWLSSKFLICSPSTCLHLSRLSYSMSVPLSDMQTLCSLIAGLGLLSNTWTHLSLTLDIAASLSTHYSAIPLTFYTLSLSLKSERVNHFQMAPPQIGLKWPWTWPCVQFIHPFNFVP